MPKKKNLITEPTLIALLIVIGKGALESIGGWLGLQLFLKLYNRFKEWRARKKEGDSSIKAK
jgi:hypothetical protein